MLMAVAGCSIESESAQRPQPLEPELLPTHRILQRWWSANGSGLHNPDVDPPTESKVPPLDNPDATCMDGIIGRLKWRSRKVVLAWYATPVPGVELNHAFGWDQITSESAWRLVQIFIRARIEEEGTPELKRLLSVRF